jgi:hypothetical protein
MATHDLGEMLAERPLRFGVDSATGCDRFDYQPGQPNLYMLMRFKQLLVAEHGLESGFDLYRRTIPRHAGAVLERKRLESHHAFCSSHALDFREIFPAGEEIVLVPPRVIGKGNHRPLRNSTRSFYVACLSNARVRGRSAVTEVGDMALADFQGDELARIDDEMEFDSGVFHRHSDDVWMVGDAQPDLEFDEAISLLGARTDFFGDWLCDYVTRYVAATLYQRLPGVPILVDASLPPTLRQALDLMLLPGSQVVEIPAFRGVQVERLWQMPGIGYMPFHQKLNEKFRWDYVAGSPARFVAVEEEMARRADRFLGADRGPSRVYLARKEFRHRLMTNFREIESIAEEYGFDIVYPEELDFGGQAKLLRDARFVVGPEGSAFFLDYFLRPGAKVCILNHEETEGLTLHNWAAGVRDRELTVITGPETNERRGRSQDMDYAIDASAFRRFLDEWLNGSLAMASADS